MQVTLAHIELSTVRHGPIVRIRNCVSCSAPFVFNHLGDLNFVEKKVENSLKLSENIGIFSNNFANVRKLSRDAKNSFKIV